MSKKLISLLLAVGMIVCMSACNTKETNSKQTDTPLESQADESSSTDEITTTQPENSQETSNVVESDENYTDETQSTTNQSSSTDISSQPAHTHKYSDATCTSPKKCSCGQTEGSALGHKYQNGICSVCNAIDEEKYVEAQVNAADKVFTDYTKYNDALKIIKAALQKFPNNATLKSKKDYYQGFAPCYLSNMTPYDKTVWFDSLDNDKDIFGTTHTNCIVKDNMAQWANATYDLSAKYNTFSATAYPRFGGGDAAGYIKIYVDGECVYSNTNISPTARPFQISLDVTGAMDLKIEYEWDSTFALSEAQVQRTVK